MWNGGSRRLLGLRTNVEFVEKGTIERTAGKAKRIVDMRKEMV